MKLLCVVNFIRDRMLGSKTNSTISMYKMFIIGIYNCNNYTVYCTSVITTDWAYHMNNSDIKHMSSACNQEVPIFGHFHCLFH